jgi:hypothetical protein
MKRGPVVGLVGLPVYTLRLLLVRIVKAKALLYAAYSCPIPAAGGDPHESTTALHIDPHSARQP